MISSATLFLATLVFHAAAVLGAPISLSAAEIAPRSLDNSASVRFARDASFPESFPAIVERAVVDSLPIIARETEDIVRRYPRRFIHEHLEKRGTTIHEKVTVTEKTIKHDNPIDTVSYNNGHPQNKCGCNSTPCNSNANGNGSGSGNGNGNSSNGVPTPTATTTPVAPAAPTPAAPVPVAPQPPVAGNTNGNTPKPADCSAQPGAAGCPTPDATTPTTTPPAASNGPSTPANSPKPDGTTTTDGPKPDGAHGADVPNPDGTTATDGSNKPAAGSQPTDGATDPNAAHPTADGSKATDGTNAAPNPATTPAPDASGANGGEGTEGEGGSTESRRRGLNVDAANQPIAKRNLAYSGAAWASSLRRRAL